jgi:AcrR family transcriptional regulator
MRFGRFIVIVIKWPSRSTIASGIALLLVLRGTAELRSLARASSRGCAVLLLASMPRARNAIRRRLPKQERSRKLVEAIVEAARITLVESGAQALTTVNVAARAGVSVGSLYQYFAGREALLYAVLEDEVARFQREWREWRNEATNAPVGERIAQGLALTLAHYRRLARSEPAFFLAHRDEIRRSLRPARTRDANHARLGTRQDLLRAQEQLARERVERVDIVSFVMTNGIQGLLDAALAHQPEVLDAPELEAELNALIAGYLLRPHVPPSAPDRDR